MRWFATLAMLLAACGSGVRSQETALAPAPIAPSDAGAALPRAGTKTASTADDYWACTAGTWSAGSGCVASTVWTPADPFRSESASDLEARYAQDSVAPAPRTLSTLVAIATTRARTATSRQERATWAGRAVMHHDKLLGAGRSAGLDDAMLRQAAALAAEAAYLLVELDATALLPDDAPPACPVGTLDELFGKAQVSGGQSAVVPFWSAFVRGEDKLDERFDQLESRYRVATWSAMSETRRGLMLGHLHAQLLDCDRQLGLQFLLFTPKEEQFLLGLQSSNDPKLVARAFEIRRATVEYFHAKTKQELTALTPLAVRHLALGLTLASASGVTNVQIQAARVELARVRASATAEVVRAALSGITDPFDPAERRTLADIHVPPTP